MTEREYISEYGRVEGDINSFIENNITNGSMIVMYTHKFECCYQQKITDTDHLLELRVFDKDKELKIMRPTIADEFFYRIIDDTKNFDDNYIEEEHYLDIDTKKSKGMDYVTTGGGRYTLPIENAERVLIRNYISYDEQGIAQITDFRVVKYIGG